MNKELKDLFISSREKESFLKGLSVIAHSDNSFSQSERTLLTCIASNIEFKGDLNVTFQNKSTEIVFDNDEQQEVFVKESIRLALIDGDYCQQERNTIFEIARTFGWSSSKFSLLEEEQEKMAWLKSNVEIEVE